MITTVLWFFDFGFHWNEHTASFYFTSLLFICWIESIRKCICVCVCIILWVCECECVLWLKMYVCVCIKQDVISVCVLDLCQWVQFWYTIKLLIVCVYIFVCQKKLVYFFLFLDKHQMVSTGKWKYFSFHPLFSELMTEQTNPPPLLLYLLNRPQGTNSCSLLLLAFLICNDTHFSYHMLLNKIGSFVMEISNEKRVSVLGKLYRHFIHIWKASFVNSCWLCF